jgi:hypothetical protein
MTQRPGRFDVSRDRARLALATTLAGLALALVAALVPVAQGAAGSLTTLDYFSCSTTLHRLQFLDTPINDGANTGGVCVKNVGTTTLTGVTSTISGDPAFYFTTQGCNGATLAPGSACQDSLNFQPSAVGRHSATYTVVADGGSSAKTTLLGNGFSGQLEILDYFSCSSSVRRLTFADTPINDGANVAGVCVKNVGNATMTGVTSSIGGDGTFYFVGHGCNGATLAPGGFCQDYPINFQPSTTGRHSATYSVAADDGSSQTATLVGKGI